ncbi:MAG: hypothetical protein GVY18_04150 [Bacteroidetes bacterium]|jgi:hypothetical protein|nr:hypothetical protein [Bacteroidota bacterium]
MLRRSRLLLLAAVTVPLLLLGSACQSPTDGPDAPAPDTMAAAAVPEPATYADTLALRALDYVGGPATWAQLPYLGFDFAIERDGDRQLVARHLWDRQSGAYRLETPAGEDSLFVTLFDVNTREGTVYLDGSPVDSTTQAAQLDAAYRRFINDTYWLLAPTKLFDPGVQRTFVPDSSTADAEALRLTFGDVGLTPEDQYWLFLDPDTGQLQRWTFLLQDQDTPRHATWTDYASVETPAGPIRLATRHDLRGAPVAILTDSLTAPAAVPPAAFTDPAWSPAP